MPAMRLTVVGSGGGFPTARRGAPCLLVEVSGAQAVLDLGSGSIGALHRLGRDIRAVDLLFLSHFHLDHAAELASWLFAVRNPEFARGGTLTVAGPEGLREHVAALDRLYGGALGPRGYSLDLVECRSSRLERGPWRITTVPTGHTAESIAARLEAQGRAVVYGGDSPPGEELARFAATADLLVLEASFPEERPHPRHLTAGSAGALAARAGVRRLLLTHLTPAVEAAAAAAAARAAFDGEILVAEDGLEVEV
jgi:ribonuclease BN (tRNA processing enzyme)